MPKVVFTQQLRRFTEAPEIESGAATLRAALEDAFATDEKENGKGRLRGYILDEQGHLRKNVVIFIDGRRVRDYVSLSDPLTPGCTVHVLQALSGG